MIARNLRTLGVAMLVIAVAVPASAFESTRGGGKFLVKARNGRTVGPVMRGPHNEILVEFRHRNDRLVLSFGQKFSLPRPVGQVNFQLLYESGDCTGPTYVYAGIAPLVPYFLDIYTGILMRINIEEDYLNRDINSYNTTNNPLCVPAALPNSPTRSVDETLDFSSEMPPPYRLIYKR